MITRKHGKIRNTSPFTKLRDPVRKPSSSSIKANHPQAPQHQISLQPKNTMYFSQNASNANIYNESLMLYLS